MKNKKIHKINKEEFNNIINELLKNETVCEMSKFRQHYTTSCLEHCLNVAYYNYVICRKLGWDYISATRAGLLHDLFLYDWRKKQTNRKPFHAFHHPKIALNNSKKLFELNPIEEDIILKHMWPLTIILPKYKESYVITIVDKYCTLKESFSYYSKKIQTKSAFRYAYIFFSLLIIHNF